ncbi:hypothetical protein HDU79_000160 [Rhizoclosmatium sp. JEL0117]|nr:hypothetical protein HDU79_000160 [Rhizoclosmatium sp. JEL0117]
MATAVSTCAAGNGIQSKRDGTVGAAILTPEVEEGPFWVAREMIRTDLVDGQPGIPMTLQVRVVSVSDCKPIANAFVDVWHVNAVGEYSGYVTQSTTNPNESADDAEAAAAGVPIPPFTSDELNALENGGAHAQLSDNLNFCRGAYQTDGNGLVTFKSIVPVYYSARTTHIHVKVYLSGTVNSDGSYSGSNGVHTGQLFFEESDKSQLYTVPPYNSVPYTYVPNESDGDFQVETMLSSDAVLKVSKTGNSLTDGIVASAIVVVDPGFRISELPQVPSLIPRPLSGPVNVPAPQQQSAVVVPPPQPPTTTSIQDNVVAASETLPVVPAATTKSFDHVNAAATDSPSINSTATAPLNGTEKTGPSQNGVPLASATANKTDGLSGGALGAAIAFPIILVIAGAVYAAKRKGVFGTTKNQAPDADEPDSLPTDDLPVALMPSTTAIEASTGSVIVVLDPSPEVVEEAENEVSATSNENLESKPEVVAVEAVATEALSEEESVVIHVQEVDSVAVADSSIDPVVKEEREE